MTLDLIDAIGLEIEKSNALLDLLRDRLEALSEGKSGTRKLFALSILVGILREKNRIIIEQATTPFHVAQKKAGAQ
jgi:hypothetical protein